MLDLFQRRSLPRYDSEQRPKRLTNSYTVRMKPQILAAAVLCRGGAMRTRISRTASVAIAALAATLTLSAAPRQAANARPYFPARGEWRKVEPAAAGFDKARLDDAIAFAEAHENPDDKNLAVAIPNQFRAEAPLGWIQLERPFSYRGISGATSRGWHELQSADSPADFAN